MKKFLSILFTLCIAIVAFTSCADSKEFKDPVTKETIKAEPYGWANANSEKVDNVVYEVNPGNLILSIIFAETIIVPVVLTGYALFEPVKYSK